MDLEKICESLRDGANKISCQTAIQKNYALEKVYESIDKHRSNIIKANAIDVNNARKNGTSESLIDRLSLDDKKIDSILFAMKTIINQVDPIGEEVCGWRTSNGLQIRQVRVPLGVIAIIYESRPNVTVDAFCLAYKSGNSILLRGSSSAIESNKAIVSAIKSGLEKGGVVNTVFLAESVSHDDVSEILNATGKIDVVIPRGNNKLIQTVVKNSRVPVIETGSGVCHLYVDDFADIEMACKIAENAKIQRPGVCNAIECIVVHKKVAKEFLLLLKKYFNKRVKIYADEYCYQILCDGIIDDYIYHADKEHYGFEFLDFACAICAVDSLEQAISFINSHNTKHSETIITNNRNNAIKFQSQIDASCVYVNASTRFTDGGEFGFGAELGISTQKLHARGPMGIKALTTTKYLIDGEGQIR